MLVLTITLEFREEGQAKAANAALHKEKVVSKLCPYWNEKQQMEHHVRIDIVGYKPREIGKLIKKALKAAEKGTANEIEADSN